MEHSLAYLADHAARAAALPAGNGRVGKPLVMSEFGLARDGQSADADDPAVVTVSKGSNPRDQPQ